MCCYSWCLYCHSCLCEAPFAVAEGVVRFGLHTTGALFCCVQGTLIGLVEGTGSGQGGGTAAAAMSGSGAVSGDDDASGGSMSGVVLERARLWCKEGVVSLAASVSLLVPCCACYVYRKFDADADEWELSPIPTLCGSVDPRRFCTFAFGQGADASNIVVDESNQSAYLHIDVRWSCALPFLPPPSSSFSQLTAQIRWIRCLVRYCTRLATWSMMRSTTWRS